MSERPNILVLMSDQHSRHALGCYGNPVVRTPNLDRLAAEGMRFNAAYCPSPLCVPSRMSFMTSRLPSRNRVWTNRHILSSAIPTWAHVLGAAGYETTLVGRMHFVGPDQRHGFELRPLGEYSARHPGVPEAGGPRWTRFPGSTSGQCRRAVEIAGTGTTTYQWFDERVTDTACRFLTERARASDRRPFAAVAGFVLPHCPFVAPADLFEYYRERVDIPAVEERQPESILRWRASRGVLEPPLNEERIRIARAAYFALCEYHDSLLGRILDCLDETGLAEDTLVVYTSDHGEMAGEHGCWWKSNYYEGSVGVPLVFRLPGVIPETSECDVICNLMDLGPTFAAAGGVDPPAGTDGRSLWTWARAEHASGWRDETFSELVDSLTGLAPSRMVRSGRWKLWLHADVEEPNPALFDLMNDPAELCDLADEPSVADVRERLIERLLQDWDPAGIAAAAREGNRDHDAIAAWGRTVRPQCTDTLAVPPPELEDDVVLL